MVGSASAQQSRQQQHQPRQVDREIVGAFRLLHSGLDSTLVSRPGGMIHVLPARKFTLPCS
jgi:hypothetical protein